MIPQASTRRAHPDRPDCASNVVRSPLPAFSRRLGEVVVGAEPEPGGLVVEPVRGGEHQDRHSAARCDDAFGDLVARGSGDVTVEDGEEAVTRYGSAKRAARWVATAQASSHVSGKAVDIGSSDARAWLSEHGAAYGLCQIYKNESWHYELRPEATVRGCPSMYADATHDPRTQR